MAESSTLTKDEVLEALRDVYDPEIPVNIVDLGLVYGVEVDVRSYGKKLILNHDALKESLSFDSWLKDFSHKFLIANIKEEGIERQVLKKLKKFDINTSLYKINYYGDPKKLSDEFYSFDYHLRDNKGYWELEIND